MKPSSEVPVAARSDDAARGEAIALLGVVIVLWGVNWPLLKIGLQAVPPLWFASFRVVVGAMTVAAVLLAKGSLRLPPRHDIPVVLSIGALQMGAFLALIHLGLEIVPPGRSSVLAYTVPLWVIPIAAVVLGERVDRVRLAALAAGLAGVAVLFNPLAVDYSDGRQLLGNGMLLAAALAWSVTIVHIRAHHWQATPLELLPWQMVLAAAILLPLARLLEPVNLELGNHVLWSAKAMAILIYNGPIATGLCFWAFVTANRKLSASTTAMASLGVPAVGIMSSALILGEPLTVTTIAGLILISTGVGTLALSSVH